MEIRGATKWNREGGREVLVDTNRTRALVYHATLLFGIRCIRGKDTVSYASNRAGRSRDDALAKSSQTLCLARGGKCDNVRHPYRPFRIAYEPRVVMEGEWGERKRVKADGYIPRSAWRTRRVRASFDSRLHLPSLRHGLHNPYLTRCELTDSSMPRHDVTIVRCLSLIPVCIHSCAHLARPHDHLLARGCVTRLRLHSAGLTFCP
jgi:hypothetical protein